jgi:hypothetical protein
VGSLIVAVTVGFLLGILLMVFLVAGREEEALVDRLEQAESSKATSPREPEDARKTEGDRRAEGISPRRS